MVLKSNIAYGYKVVFIELIEYEMIKSATNTPIAPTLV